MNYNKRECKIWLASFLRISCLAGVCFFAWSCHSEEKIVPVKSVASPQATAAPSPAVTPEPTATPAPTESPAPTETSSAGAPAPRMGDRLTTEAVRLHRGEPGVVHISWDTQSEENSFGFNVMRASDPKGKFEPANKQPILGAGTSSTNITYDYYDTEVKIGDVFYYYIQEIDLNGQTQDEMEMKNHPVTVTHQNLDLLMK